MEKLARSLYVKTVLPALVCTLAGLSLFGQVRVWEEDLVIPSWKLGPPETNPTFSWSSGRQEVYPYPYKEILTDEKTDQTYRACWLENEYIKVLVLPEIGGRLHGARDKTNNYNFFYWQPTIKPALVGMTGAWISGGIEWNFPHGHRPTGFSPVQHRLVDNPDGSKTVWVGEMELVQRMRWIVGLTVYPGKSVVEAKVRLLNSTPIRHSYQMWTTTAVHANEQYQAIFPTRLMTGHGKTEYFHWPVDEGVDISWWKNVPNASSFFAVEPGEFFGGWDNGANAGTVIVGDPHVIVGKKFWTWGTSPSGRIWEPILTEGGGPYLEPQAGAYSDNQPDYHWLEPGEVKVFSHFFFPVRDIGPFKKANIHGALNLEFDGDTVKLGAYSTSVLKGAILRLTSGDRMVFEETLDIDPSTPQTREISVAAAPRNAESFVLSFLTAAGEELLSYSPEILAPLDLPEPAKIYPPPKEIQTGDELWHAGDALYKFRDPDEGRAYFEEAVRRDAGDTRSRISLAELDIKMAHFREALDHLNIARERDPDNGRLFYLRGLAQESSGLTNEAYDSYMRAVHFEEFLPRAYERVARLDLLKGEAGKAVLHTRRAIHNNQLNPLLWALQATAERRNRASEAALKAAEFSLSLDPLLPWAANEVRLSLLALGRPADSASRLLSQLLGGDTRLAIETSLQYSGAGLYEEAKDILQMVELDPLVGYHLGFLFQKLGRNREATEAFQRASRSSVENVFPFRIETLGVLQAALGVKPDDAAAHYYLGMVYAKVGDTVKAQSHWARATERDPGNSKAWRNLGLIAWKAEANPMRALQYYRKAQAAAPEDPRVLLELDTVSQEAGVSSADRLALLKGNAEVVKKRDDLIAATIDLLIGQGEFADALAYLRTNHFNSWEGGYSIHNSYMEANIGLAERTREPEEALKHYEDACLYPDNLEVAPREPDLRGFLYYPMSELHQQLGRQEEARKLLEIVASEESMYPTLANYYRARALHALGKPAEAEQILSELEREAEAMLAGTSAHYERTGERLRTALGNLYLSRVHSARGDSEASERYLEAARSYSGIERQAVMVAQRVYARAHQ